MTVKRPKPWTKDEDRAIAAAYRRGGGVECQRVLPHRTRKAIDARVLLLRSLGVEIPARPGAKLRKTVNPFGEGKAALAELRRHRLERKKYLRRIREARGGEGALALGKVVPSVPGGKEPRFDSHALLMRLAEGIDRRKAATGRPPAGAGVRA